MLQDFKKFDATCPYFCFKIFRSDYGVFAKKLIPKACRFGPIEGQITSASNSAGNYLQFFKNICGLKIKLKITYIKHLFFKCWHPLGCILNCLLRQKLNIFLWSLSSIHLLFSSFPVKGWGSFVLFCTRLSHLIV